VEIMLKRIESERAIAIRRIGERTISDARARANVHGKSVQEILQRILSGEQSRAMRAKASLPYSNPHGLPLAAYFPTPGILAASAAENRDIK
jgi:plasmid stability protein